MLILYMSISLVIPSLVEYYVMIQLINYKFK